MVPPVAAPVSSQNTNPAIVAPESAMVRKGLARDDLFTVVHEQFMTDTAAMADLVLPATMFVEHDDLYTASAHANVQVTKKLFEPFALCRTKPPGGLRPGPPGGCRASGLRDDRVAADRRHAGQEGGCRDAETMFRARRPRPCCRRMAATSTMASRPRTAASASPRPGASTVSHHKTMPSLPDHQPAIEAPDADHPYRLVAAPSRQFLNSSFTEMPTGRAREVRPTALLHPDAMAGLSLADGDLVQVGNQRGVVQVHAKTRQGAHPATVVIEGVWPKDGFLDRTPVNTLISAEPGLPNGGGAFHDTAVWVAAGERPACPSAPQVEQQLMLSEQMGALRGNPNGDDG